MSAVYDGDARVLPGPVDERATVGAWSAHLAADADLRTKAKPYRALAAQLSIRPATGEPTP